MASCNSSENSVGNATSTFCVSCALDLFSAFVTDSQNICLFAYSSGACPVNIFVIVLSLNQLRPVTNRRNGHNKSELF